MTDGPSARVSRTSNYQVERMPWGQLVWMVAGRLNNSATMTVGRCHIEPGRENPRHHHPNCDEVLYVLQGAIEHSAGDSVVGMWAGDTISIPAGVVHNARNVGVDEAVFVISFNSADRHTIGE